MVSLLPRRGFTVFCGGANGARVRKPRKNGKQANRVAESTKFYGALRKRLNELPGLRILSLPAQLAEKQCKVDDVPVLARNIIFESEWVRYGRVTLLDASQKVQVCCGVMYMDCMADGPPFVFDVIILEGGESWMLSLDFAPLFEDPDYRATYMAGLDQAKKDYHSLVDAFPNDYCEKERWLSKSIIFSTGRSSKKDSSSSDDLLEMFSEVVDCYINVLKKSWACSRGRLAPGIVLEKQLEFLEWMEGKPQPSTLLVRKHLGLGWNELMIKSAWKDTHGLSRWGGPHQTRAAYHEVYEDVLRTSKGDVKEANRKLVEAGLAPLEYIYFNPNPNMWDLDESEDDDDYMRNSPYNKSDIF